MPALSPTMEEGKLAKWLKNVGENIKSGDVLAEIQTDKATMEVEAVHQGPLTANSSWPRAPEKCESEYADCSDRRSANAAPLPVPFGHPLPQGGGQISYSFSLSAEAGCESAVDEGALLRDLEISRRHRNGDDERARSQPPCRHVRRNAPRDKGRVPRWAPGEPVRDLSAYKMSQGTPEEFGPQRVTDTPITEHGFTGIATGAAFLGLKPIVNS